MDVSLMKMGSRAIWISVGLAACLLLGGCAGGIPMLDAGQSVSMADFSDPTWKGHVRPDAAAVQDAMVESGLRLPKPQGPSVVEEALSETFEFDVRPGETVIVDSLIGQVNGRPIFADQILAPIMDQLNAEFGRMEWQRFRMYVVQLVSQRLREVIHNELFLAEARAGLTEQQETGFLAWMNNMRGILIGQHGGVSADAEREILEQEGKTIDEYLKLQEEQQLIQVLFSERVRPNALVSWRDVERAWESRQREFNEASTVTLGRIRLRTEGNEEQIKLLQDELDAGEPFNIVAAQAGMKDDGIWETFEFGDKGLEGIEIADFYKEHLKGLGPGETSKAFERGSRTIWVSVLEINESTKRTLFDPEIQRVLYRDIYSRRLGDAQNDFIKSIVDEGILDDVTEMEDKIVRIALSRFLARK